MKRFHGKTIFLDTAPLIYFFEENSAYFKMVEPFFLANKKGSFNILSSVITLSEILIRPMLLNDNHLTEVYRDSLSNSTNFKLVEVNKDIAVLASELRVKYGYKTPDALILASAISSNADYILTNDKHLKSFKEVEVITIDEL